MYRIQTTDATHVARIVARPEDNEPGRGAGRISSQLKNVSNGAHTSFVLIPGGETPAVSTKMINVAMGCSTTHQGDHATLSTRSLSDCSALAVMTDWNGRTYDTRTLMHVIGSNLEFGLVDGDAFELLGELRDSLARGGKVIWVGGTNSQSDVGLAISLGQTDRVGNQPLLDLLNIQGVSITLAGASGIDVKADGTFTLTDNIGRGVLTKEEVTEVLAFI
jgi:hypothetical protein